MSGPVLEPTHEAMAASLAAAAQLLAARIGDGGILWCVAPGLEDHARHLAVEFVHPASVGARAVAAVALPGLLHDAFFASIRSSVRAGDVIISMGDADTTMVDELGTRSRAGGVTHVHLGWTAEHRAGGRTAEHRAGGWTAEHRTGGSPTLLVRIGVDASAERSLTRAYHLLWELTFVCLRSPVMCPTEPGERRGGATSFLYPSLVTGPEPEPTAKDGPPPNENAGAALLEELAATVRATWSDAVALDDESRAANASALDDASMLVVARTSMGGRLLVMGNGGSACDADRLVRLVRDMVPARSLLDPAVLSAIANDVGAARMFARQVETFATPSDVVIVFTTSGTSPNVVEAVAAAKRAGAATIAFVGYGGAALAGHDDVDVGLSVESSSVHRIQETQGALCNALVARIAEARKDAA